MQIYISRNEEQFGPYTLAEVQEHLTTGALFPSDLFWHDGQNGWKPLAEVIEPPERQSPAPASSTSPSARPLLPSRNKRRLIICGVALLLLYGISPYVSCWRLRNALESGDVDSLESHIDFPAVRESLKDQLRAEMAKTMAKDKDAKDNPFSGLAMMVGPLMVSSLVDNYVTPSGISALIADSKSLFGNENSANASKSSKTSLDWSKARHAFFTGPTQFMLDLGGSKLRFHFTGLGWQLKRIEIKLDDPSPTTTQEARQAVQDPNGVTKKTTELMISVSGGQFEMAAEDDANKRYTVLHKSTGKLTTVYWDARKQAPVTVEGDFSAIPDNVSSQITPLHH